MNTKILDWLKAQNWSLLDHQKRVHDCIQKRQSGLLHATTGSGKTYALWLSILDSFLDKKKSGKKLRVVWITPMRALAKDTVIQLEKPLSFLQLNWRIGLRTSDTSDYQKKQQIKNPPEVMVTTPESLSVLMSYQYGKQLLGSLDVVVVDEWHELLATKRGVQTQLCLARLNKWCPDHLVWGLSATLGNLHEALAQLCGQKTGVLIEGTKQRSTDFHVIRPKQIDLFPWAGHLGLNQINLLIPYLERKQSTLVFTNVRSHTEYWYQAILKAKPEWAGQIAIHHSSINKETRLWVEEQLRAGRLKVVVCTSSLDLGVDFSPVDQVVQIGSVKGIARLQQRAGRSHHQPDQTGEVVLLPTHVFEIIEYEAAMNAMADHEIEPRKPLAKPYDVLIQHVITIALGEGFDADVLFDEIRQCPCYQDLTRQEWFQILSFIEKGGHALDAYPEYQKVVNDKGVYRVVNRRVALRHRMNIGTISSDAMLRVKFQRGHKIADVEERFVSQLHKGDVFILAGRHLEFLRIKDMDVIVRLSSRKAKLVPRWVGGRLPLSSQLSCQVRKVIAQQANNTNHHLTEIFEQQKKVSALPEVNEILVEQIQTKEGYHTFIFPFAGRQLNEMIASLFAYRSSQVDPKSISIAVNDYGFELCCDKPWQISETSLKRFCQLDNLLDDVIATADEAKMAQRQFRDIARIAGLVFQGYPGSQKSIRQIQASSGLIFDVLKKYDADNILLQQASREVLEDAFCIDELRQCLSAMYNHKWLLRQPKQLTPFSFPLWVDLQRLTLSNEDLQSRITKVLANLYANLN